MTHSRTAQASLQQSCRARPTRSSCSTHVPHRIHSQPRTARLHVGDVARAREERCAANIGKKTCRAPYLLHARKQTLPHRRPRKRGRGWDSSDAPQSSACAAPRTPNQLWTRVDAAIAVGTFARQPACGRNDSRDRIRQALPCAGPQLPLSLGTRPSRRRERWITSTLSPSHPRAVGPPYARAAGFLPALKPERL